MFLAWFIFLNKRPRTNVSDSFVLEYDCDKHEVTYYHRGVKIQLENDVIQSLEKLYRTQPFTANLVTLDDKPLQSFSAFTILKQLNYNVDNVDKLPLPSKLKDFIITTYNDCRVNFIV